MPTLTITTTSPTATQKLATKIATNLHGDETLAMTANLGGGKTTFTQGLAKGLGVTKRVVSPTFVLERIYQGQDKKIELHHFDVYRITPADIYSIGLLEVLGNKLTVVEWADKIKAELPADSIWVSIKSPSDTARQFTFEYPESKNYVFKNVK